MLSAEILSIVHNLRARRTPVSASHAHYMAGILEDVARRVAKLEEQVVPAASRRVGSLPPGSSRGDGARGGEKVVDLDAVRRRARDRLPARSRGSAPAKDEGGAA